MPQVQVGQSSETSGAACRKRNALAAKAGAAPRWGKEKPVCFRFNTSVCDEPCPNHRAHVCQVCLGDHPLMERPKKLPNISTAGCGMRREILRVVSTSSDWADESRQICARWGQASFGGFSAGVLSAVWLALGSMWSEGLALPPPVTSAAGYRLDLLDSWMRVSAELDIHVPQWLKYGVPTGRLEAIDCAAIFPPFVQMTSVVKKSASFAAQLHDLSMRVIETIRPLTKRGLGKCLTRVRSFGKMA
eukprot:468011-Amphidinium_carterae.2